MTTYKVDSMGKYIPASQRPDGTWRKARRVKEGYVPQEEVPLYESKGKIFAKSKSALPPGVCPFVIDEKTKAKREAAAAAAAAAAANAASSPSTSSNSVKMSSGNASAGAIPKKTKSQDTASKTNKADKHKGASSANDLADQFEKDLKIGAAGGGVPVSNELPQLELSRLLKKYKKKLREIESLEEKLKTRELKNPDKEQLDKIKKKKEVIAEISRLEMLVAQANEN